MKYLVCKKCGNMVEMVQDKHTHLVCCGEVMPVLEANSVDASGEKHLPIMEVDGKNVTVKVGSVEHPMAEEHHIAWVTLVTKKGIQRQALKAGEKPEEVCFSLCGEDEAVSAYEYCNLHGLWKVENN